MGCSLPGPNMPFLLACHNRRHHVIFWGSGSAAHCKVKICTPGLLRATGGILSLQAEPDVKLLSYQHNRLQSLKHLEMLPSLVFLDCYSNRITSLSGLREISGLRVLMLARNNITDLSGAGPSKITELRGACSVCCSKPMAPALAELCRSLAPGLWCVWNVQGGCQIVLNK
jgi:hypothetical protein